MAVFRFEYSMESVLSQSSILDFKAAQTREFSFCMFSRSKILHI